MQPVQGRDIKGPTAAFKSVCKLGYDVVPNGASYVITLSPTSLRDDEHLKKFAALLRAYEKLGGTSLQVNLIDAETLRDARKHPENYQNLLVRVTGYNAYFVMLGKEMQDEIIARTAHKL
nr:glycine radical domain-containing protein [Candidatus Njordarchaeota archaeon]